MRRRDGGVGGLIKKDGKEATGQQQAFMHGDKRNKELGWERSRGRKKRTRNLKW